MNITTVWYQKHWLSRLLLPLSWFFRAVVALRRLAYRQNWLRSETLSVPVIVVGNITVGGAGKTPVVLWLANWLLAQGRRPGIVSRGYGGQASEVPQFVTPASDPSRVGDEPVLLACRAGCPVAVSRDRVAAARLLIADHNCDVIVSDDGLQHYALARDVEIVVVDGARRFGNGELLPAGPLREPLSRLRAVEFIVTDRNPRSGEYLIARHCSNFVAVTSDEFSTAPSAWRGRRVHGVAGIANPTRFFDSLCALGLDVVRHPFPDHYLFQAGDLAFAERLPIIMTEKDAVKCRSFATAEMWYAELSCTPDASFVAALAQKITHWQC